MPTIHEASRFTIGKSRIATLAALLAGLLLGGCAQDMNRTATASSGGTKTDLRADLRGGTEVPLNRGVANGYFEGTYDSATHYLNWEVKWALLKGSPTTVEFLMPAGVSQTVNGSSGTMTLSPVVAEKLLAGKLHVNIATTKYPNGEVRGRIHADSSQAAVDRMSLSAYLTGEGEIKHNDSSGMGIFAGNYDPAKRQLDWQLYARDLSGPSFVSLFDERATAHRITPNSMRGSVMLSDDQAADLLAGRWAVNLDTNVYPIGEIRGQIVPQK
jgi:hypothetical protein